MENKAQRMEELIERSIDSVTTHPAFLLAVTTVINANSYRKIWLRKSFEAIWKDLELPVRQEHEKLVSQVEELAIRIKRLERSLEPVASHIDSPTVENRKSVSSSKKKLRSKEMELQ